MKVEFLRIKKKLNDNISKPNLREYFGELNLIKKTNQIYKIKALIILILWTEIKAEKILHGK